MVIFTHTFLFGLLSKLDPTGRATAATPAMMMVGSCIGPVLGGAIVAGLGYPGLGWAASAVAAVAVAGMWQVRGRSRAFPWRRRRHRWFSKWLEGSHDDHPLWRDGLTRAPRGLAAE